MMRTAAIPSDHATLEPPLSAGNLAAHDLTIFTSAAERSRILSRMKSQFQSALEAIGRPPNQPSVWPNERWRRRHGWVVVAGIRQVQVIFDSADTRRWCARQWLRDAMAFGGAGRFHLGSTVGELTSHEADRNHRAPEFSVSSARRTLSAAARRYVRLCLTNARGATARSLRARESRRPSSFRFPEIHPVSGGRP